MSNTTNNYNGIGFPVILTIVFIILKATNVIDWSWWWVTAPLWIGFLIGIVIFLIYGAMLLVGLLIVNKKRKR